jgi:branched-chain amino acid transport system ATP-binding protein
MLDVDDVTKTFGGVRALDGVSFSVERAEIRGVIGPNGAGKTTLLDVLTGVVEPERGRVVLDGQRLDGLPSHRRAALGLLRTFQDARLVAGLTVRENVMLGAQRLTRTGFLADGLRLRPARREEREVRARAQDAVELLGLEGLVDQPASALSTGARRLVTVATAVAGSPCLLVLDEPAAGLDRDETNELARVLRRVRDSGTTTILVEHDVELVFAVSDHVLVLDAGRVVADAASSVVRVDPAVAGAYLGVRRLGA